jgi:hypothetical protein
VSWSAEAFARAKAQGKPILAAIGPLPPEQLEAAEGEIARRFVAVLADPETRPDAAARIGAGHAVVLDPDGARRAVLPLPTPGLGEELALLALEAVTPLRPDAPSRPAWTGAVRETDYRGPDASKVPPCSPGWALFRPRPTPSSSRPCCTRPASAATRRPSPG